MSADQTHTGSPVDSLESGGAAGRHDDAAVRSASADAECGTAAACGACSLAGGGGCGTVRYCSEACCKAHWRAHKAECRRLQVVAKAGEGGRGQD